MSHREQEPFRAEEVLFNANLQEFASKIGFVCGLESNGKLSSVEAYKRIKTLWKELRRSKKGLRIGEDDLDHDSSDEDAE